MLTLPYMLSKYSSQMLGFHVQHTLLDSIHSQETKHRSITNSLQKQDRLAAPHQTYRH